MAGESGRQVTVDIQAIRQGPHPLQQSREQILRREYLEAIIVVIVLLVGALRIVVLTNFLDRS